MSIVIKALRSALLSMGLALAIVPAAVQMAAGETEVNIVEGYAVHGYDVVAYFKQGKPVAGDSRFTAQHEGVTYRFSSAEHRDAFTSDPASYAPQYGGYCAFGAAMGRKFDGDPTTWAIVDGKLYLNYSLDVQKQWKGDVSGNIDKADSKWPNILDTSNVVYYDTVGAVYF